jgi:hypothetical protein
MEDAIHVVKEGLEVNVVEIRFQEPKALVSAESLKVHLFEDSRIVRVEIVNSHNAAPFPQKPFGSVTPDKTCAARDEYSQ